MPCGIRTHDSSVRVSEDISYIRLRGHCDRPGIYIAVVFLTWVVQWLRLAIFEGPKKEGVSQLTWGRKEIQFPKLCILHFLEYWMINKAQNPINYEHSTPSAEPFRIY
jgi:hypothetical protein